jgi:hypothetical protein
MVLSIAEFLVCAGDEQMELRRWLGGKWLYKSLMLRKRVSKGRKAGVNAGRVEELLTAILLCWTKT